MGVRELLLPADTSCSQLSLFARIAGKDTRYNGKENLSEESGCSKLRNCATRHNICNITLLPSDKFSRTPYTLSKFTITLEPSIRRRLEEQLPSSELFCCTLNYCTMNFYSVGCVVFHKLKTIFL